MINLEWVRHGAGVHKLFPASADVLDDAGHALATAYAVKRPDGEWSVMLVNKDASNAHRLKVLVKDADGTERHFSGTVDMVTFGAEQYVWHPEGAKSHADPDGPLRRTSMPAGKDSSFELPRASVTVLRGHLTGQ